MQTFDSAVLVASSEAASEAAHEVAEHTREQDKDEEDHQLTSGWRQSKERWEP